MTKMFPFITNTKCNIIGGKCIHECIYCWANKLTLRNKLLKYTGEPYWDNDYKLKFVDGDFVFVQDMSDLYADNVPMQFIEKMVDIELQNPTVKFLNLTKNPKRYFDVLNLFGDQSAPNISLGATIESNHNYPIYSKAPSQDQRLSEMKNIRILFPTIQLFICVEPILDFDLEKFIHELRLIQPYAVAVGYDNYNNRLIEPSKIKTMRLVNELRKFTTVYEKTIRKAWDEP